MYICMHGSLLDHVPHDYCTLETCIEKVPLIACHFMIHKHMHGLCMHQVHSTCSLIGTLLFISQDWRTALHYASEGGHHDTVRVLLERQTDPNPHDKVSGV